MSRMRVGEWLAAAGAVGLFVLLFFDWFSVDGHSLGWKAYAPSGAVGPSLHLSGWGSLGWFMDILLCVLIFGGAALSYMTVKRASPAWPVGAAVLTWVLGSVSFVVLAVRVALQPGLGAGLANEPVLVEAPAYLGLLCAFLIPLGGLISLRDERTRSPEARAYMPPPARTAPGT
jgi:hypothetical protein